LFCDCEKDNSNFLLRETGDESRTILGERSSQRYWFSKPLENTIQIYEIKEQSPIEMKWLEINRKPDLGMGFQLCCWERATKTQVK
jgi:hypothetical protein